MEAMIMFTLGVTMQIVLYTVSAFFAGLAVSVGWHLGKRLTRG